MSDSTKEPQDERRKKVDGERPGDDPSKRAAELADTDPVEKGMTEEEKKRFRGGR